MKRDTMNKVGVKTLSYVVFGVGLLLLLSPPACAALTIHDAQTTDVTASGFSVVWRTSEPATPRIAVFTDPAGTVEVTSALEIRSFPLFSGSPDILDDFQREEEMDVLRETAKTLGLIKISVHGCLPQTTYYFKIFSGNGIEDVVWPESGSASAVTANTSEFVADAQQVLVTLTDDVGTLNPQGWLMTAANGEATYPISTYVGDGAAANQAYLDLSNLYDGNAVNWTPIGLQVVSLEVRLPGADPFQRGLALYYSDAFHVATLNMISVNIDEAGDQIPPEVLPSLPGDTYPEPQHITLTANEDAYIFYTLDDSEPTPDSNLYSDPIYIDHTATLRFMAVDMTGNQSSVQSALYAIAYNQPPYAPSSPAPPVGAAGVSVETSLSWQSAGDPDPEDAVTYDVYVWIDENTGPPVCHDQSMFTCQPADLQFETTYFWQVVAKDTLGEETSGAVWHFSTFSQDGDEDGDGLSNGDELDWMTNPHDWDTDKDGYSDFEEISVGSDPLEKGVRPPYYPGFGDVDGDQDIDGEDLALLLVALNTISGDEAYRAEADLNSDGVIDTIDLDLFSRVFGLAFDRGYDLASDFDGDGDVDGFDLSLLVSRVGLTENDVGWDGRFDLNPDGEINQWDVAFFSMVYGAMNE